MIKRIKGFYLVVSSIFIYLLHLPVAFAKSASGHLFFNNPEITPAVENAEVIPAPAPAPAPAARSVYDSLHLDLSGLSKQAYDFAKRGFDKLVAEGKLLNDSIISVIDFSLPSNKKRLYVLDTKNYKVLFNTLVAHGRNTGREWATDFSNQESSYKSSPGFYITGTTYEGKNGYSLKLEGIEHGLNDNAYERGIVMHGAPYVSDAFVNAQGFIGRSQGCPAVPVQQSKPIINRIKNGTCLFIYHPSQVRKSPLLKQS